jgi:hypothetical protein
MANISMKIWLTCIFILSPLFIKQTHKLEISVCANKRQPTATNCAEKKKILLMMIED